MADLSSVTDNYLPTASETFTDNLSGSISAGATTVPVNSAVEYADGDTVVLTVDPGTANEATFVGKKDVGSNQFIECIWTEGNTAVGHDAGATIIDYDSATHYNLLSEALQLIMNQDGTLKDTPIRTALGLSELSNDGWEVFPYTFSVSSTYNKGGKFAALTVANQDVTSLLSKGMRLRLERNTAAPTQCADLERSSTQYASLASASISGTIGTFTDDYTVEAWIKPESFGANQTIVSRRTASTAGWDLRLLDDGRIDLISLRIASNNRAIRSYQPVQLKKWTHIAASSDLSGNSHAVYINGISVPFENSLNGTVTALVQSGDLAIGAYTGGNQPFDGKIAEVRVWSGSRTQTEIQDNMNQALTGSESNLIGYWALNGDFNDGTSNNNDLAGSGSAAATDTDNPFSDTEYAIVAKVSYSAPNSTVIVYTGDNHNIPNMTLTSPYYSVQKVPYGFPGGAAIWEGCYRQVANLDGKSAVTLNLPSASSTLIAPFGISLYLADVSTLRIRMLADINNADTNGWGTLRANRDSATDVVLSGDWRSGSASDAVRLNTGIDVDVAAGAHTYVFQMAESGSTATTGTCNDAEFVIENTSLGALY